MALRILFVDDERLFMKRYREVLDDNFTVTFIDNVVEALEFLRGTPSIDALLLDIMMPPASQATIVATGGGLNTGLWLLQELKIIYDPWILPVFILTNRSLSVVSNAVKQLGSPQQFMEIRSKIETPAFYLPGAVEVLISRGRGGGLA